MLAERLETEKKLRDAVKRLMGALGRLDIDVTVKREDLFVVLSVLTHKADVPMPSLHPEQR